MEVEIDHRDRSRRVRRWRAAGLALGLAPRFCSCVDEHALAFDEQAVLADEQVEVRPLLVGELEEDLLAFGVLEPLAVALEERCEPRSQRMPIISACGR